MAPSLATRKVGIRVQSITWARDRGSVRVHPLVHDKEASVAGIFQALTPAVKASNVEAESKSGGGRRKRGKRRGKRGGRRSRT